MSIKYQILKNVPEFDAGHPGYKNAYPSIESRKQYFKSTLNFAYWIKESTGYFNFRKQKENIIDSLNDYVVFLADRDLSATTIHNYVAGICYAFRLPMALIHKPIRHIYNNRRRKVSSTKPTFSNSKECSPRLYIFASMVGIRRDEYLQLFGKCLRFDESGHLCVAVPKGKGGKYQLQRILPFFQNEVAAFFDGSDEKIFSLKEMKNKLDLHKLRGNIAKIAYTYYYNRIKNEPGYREQLEEEIHARWERFRVVYENALHREQLLKLHPSWRWDINKVRGVYKLRGKNKEWAEAHGFPSEYDRLALMATSIFHLSHWRADVAVNNYILTIS